MPHPQAEKLKAIVTPPIEGAGYELVELEWKREQAGWVCRVFLDRQDGAKISLEDCERMSRELSAVLDVSDSVTQAYALEVSSPGLDRPLRTAAHFRRYSGQRAKVKLALGVDGRRNFDGTIMNVPDDRHVELEVDGQRYLLPLDDLERANLVFNWSE